VALLCGRLPQQLAELRAHLRKLGSYCDSLQATLASTHMRGGSLHDSKEASLENLEVEHASTIGQAKLLLTSSGASGQHCTSSSAQLESGSAGEVSHIAVGTC